MDFVDEENVPFTQVGEGSNKITRFFEGRPGGGANVDSKLSRYQPAEGRLAESRWSVADGMIEGLTACERGIDPDSQALFDLFLADELGQPLRAERQLDDGFVGERLRCGDLGA